MNAARRRVVFALLPAWALSAAAAPPPDPAAVADVLAGRRAEARAEWWGFNPTNATAPLQAALTSGARRVTVGHCGSPWIVDPLVLRGGLEVVFESGAVVEARRGGYTGKSDCLFSAETCTNLVLRGPGATLRMWQEDYATTNYAAAEWRHCIRLRACVDVKIEGLTLARSGGDGVYIGAGSGGAPCRNVVIRDVICDGHHRQGISVISAEGLLIERTALINTRGTAPMAGIDFEPNHPSERLVDCVMRDCVLTNNAGGGFLFALHHMNAAARPVSFRIERCTSSANRRAAVYWNSASGSNGATRGTAVFADCTLSAETGHVVTVANAVADGSSMTFANCRIEARDPKGVPLLITARREAANGIGGVAIDGGRVSSAAPGDASPMDWRSDGRLRALHRVTGRFEFASAEGRTAVSLDDRQLEIWFPDVAVARLPSVAIDAVRDVPATPVSGASWRLRHEAELVVRAADGEEVQLAVKVEKVGPAPHRIPLRVTGPSGAEALSRMVEAGDEARIAFTAAAAGLHRIEAGGGSCVFRIRSATHALCVATDRRPAHFFGTTGDHALSVPAGTHAFAAWIVGSGDGEGVKASLVDPAGSAVKVEDDIAHPRVLHAVPPAGARDAGWRLRLERPSTIHLEDYSLQLFGIPPVLAPAAPLKEDPR